MERRAATIHSLVKVAMDKQPSERNSGIIWCNSKITKPADLSKNDFSKWYSNKHVPDTIRTGLVQEAYRYESIDPDAEAPFLALYYAADIGGLAEKLKCKHRSLLLLIRHSQ